MSRAGKPRILYLNGIRFRRALIAGAKQLIENRERLNDINVFPVADGDTGTNMAGTLDFIVEGIAPVREKAIDRMLRTIADLALSGARGCSGTILAQFLHGLAQELADSVRVTTAPFGHGVRRAVRYPYEAVSEPKEGTMLTVLRDWGETVYEWSDRTDDFAELLARAYLAAQSSLERTRYELEILSRAGVVDAGAQGLVHMLTGVTRFIAHGRLREFDTALSSMRQETELPSEVVENPSRRYCTQFVVEGSGFDVGGLRGELVSLGDSLIIAGSGTKAKIHIHSDSPDAVFHKASSRGSITSQRIEDMAAQFRAAHVPHADIAIVVDSSCDLPAEDWEKNDIYMVPIVLNLEGRSYLDKYTITPEAFFSLIHDGARGHPTTSQPAPAEYRGRFEFLLRHYSSVISLSISSGISGTFDAAKSGARLAGGDVTVIDSKTTSIGLGLLARRIAEAVRAGASKEEAVRLAESLVSRVRVHLAARSLEALVRSGRVGRAKGFAANLLHLAPLIRLNAATDGKPVQGPLFMGVRDGVRKILRHMEREIGGGRPTDFAVAHANAKGNADWFRDRIVKSFSPRREPYVVDATTVLAAHIGEGAVGVGYILEEG